MKLYKGTISTTQSQSGAEFQFEMEDDSTLEEIEEAAQDAAFSFVNWHFAEVEEIEKK